MRNAAYDVIASTVHERLMESRNQTRRKVLQLAADLAAIFAHEDKSFDIVAFYRTCGFSGEDVAVINEGTRAVDFAALDRHAATDPGDDTTHQGYKNYETFTVAFAIGNDRRLKSEAEFLAKSMAIGAEYPDVRAAEALRKWVEEKLLTEKRGAEVEDVLSGIGSTLLNSAMGEVDWLEVAHEFLGMRN